MPRPPLRAALIGVPLFALHALAAQSPAAAPTVTVTGVVFDSLARAPLAGADVQLVRTGDAGHGSFTVTTDAAGAYRIAGVPAGRYLAGFFHPALDSLGLQAPPREVELRADRARLDLAIPSAATVLRALCPSGDVSDSTALVVGFVRDATTLAPRPRAAVRLGWAALVLGPAGLRREVQQVEVRARENGWYAACGVPAGRPLMLRAAEGADTSGVVDAELPGRQLVREDLWIGPSSPAGSAAPDSGAFGTAERRTGPAVLRGTVRAATGQPIAGARVSLRGSPDSAVTGEDGRFALAGLPAGSWMLEARAVGYLPTKHVVALLATPEANTASLTMTSFRAYLDTVRVTTSRVYASDRTGFEERRRTSGTGHFIDRAMIERHRAMRATDLLRLSPGILVTPAGGDNRIEMVAPGFSRAGRSTCTPAIYIDGMLFGPANSVRIDDFLTPDDLAGFEVYPRGTTVPMRFSTMANEGCGVIVVWTRRPGEGSPVQKQ